MTHAQAQEDDWAVNQFEQGFKGFAVDVGAYDGITRSNTYLLEELGWTVLCIEPNPEMVKALKKNRPFVEAAACDAESGTATLKVHLDNTEAYTSLRPTYHKKWHPEPGAKWAAVEVQVISLNEALDKWEFPRLDLLSIDTEGTELDVLKGIDLKRWQPKVIIAESWDEECPMNDYLAEQGYEKVGRLMVNNLYLKETE